MKKGRIPNLADGPKADFFAPAIEDTEELMEPTPCILEVFSRVPAAEKRGCRFRGNYLDAAGRVIDLDSGIAVAAAKISHERKLPLTDAVIVATAGIYNAVLWTLDSDLRDVEGVIFVEKR